MLYILISVFSTFSLFIPTQSIHYINSLLIYFFSYNVYHICEIIKICKKKKKFKINVLQNVLCAHIIRKLKKKTLKNCKRKKKEPKEEKRKNKRRSHRRTIVLKEEDDGEKVMESKKTSFLSCDVNKYLPIFFLTKYSLCKDAFMLFLLGLGLTWIENKLNE